MWINFYSYLTSFNSDLTYLDGLSINWRCAVESHREVERRLVEERGREISQPHPVSLHSRPVIKSMELHLTRVSDRVHCDPGKPPELRKTWQDKLKQTLNTTDLFLSKTHNCFTVGQLVRNSVASILITSCITCFCSSCRSAEKLMTARLLFNS